VCKPSVVRSICAQLGVLLAGPCRVPERWQNDRAKAGSKLFAYCFLEPNALSSNSPKTGRSGACTRRDDFTFEHPFSLQGQNCGAPNVHKARVHTSSHCTVSRRTSHLKTTCALVRTTRCNHVDQPTRSLAKRDLPGNPAICPAAHEGPRGSCKRLTKGLAA
jgi:hypothetical protein